MVKAPASILAAILFPGTNFSNAPSLFVTDPATESILMVGEINGTAADKFASLEKADVHTMRSPTEPGKGVQQATGW